MNRLLHYGLIPSLVLVACPAQADWSYYAYDSFPILRDAFQKIALLNAAPEYQALFMSFAILGLLIGGVGSAFKSLLATLDGSPKLTFSWLGLSVAGIVIYLAFVQVTTTVHLYDVRSNQYQTVGKVPLLVAALAGFTSSLEYNLGELIKNHAASPQTIEFTDRDVSARLLYDASTGLNRLDFTHAENLKQYYRDCMVFAEARGQFSVQDLLMNEDTGFLMEALKNSSHKSLYTTQVSTDSHGKPTRQTLTCEAAWTALKTTIQRDTFWKDGFTRLCRKNGFTPLTASDSQAAATQRCQQVMDRALGTYLASDNKGQTLSTPTFMRNTLIASVIAQALQQENPDLSIQALSNKAIIDDGLGIATVTKTWFPIVRALIVSLVLAAFPLVALLIVTGLMPRILRFYTGIFVWLSFWGFFDLILHQSMVDLMVQQFYQVQHQGLAALWSMPNVTQKALTAIAQMRVASIMISGVFAAGLGFAVSHMMAQFASNLSHGFGEYGREAARDTLSPTRTSQQLDQLAEANAQQAFLHEKGLDQLEDTKHFNLRRTTSAARTATDQLGTHAADAGERIGADQGGQLSGSADVKLGRFAATF